MPIKVLSQLRLLSPALPISLVPKAKHCSQLACFRSINNTLSLVFPLRLNKFAAFGTRVGARPFRARGAARSAQDFGREARASKSLIEDEAELSDWVSDLRTSSIRGRQTSDEDSDSDMAGKRNRGGVGGRGRGEGAREGLPVKRRREGETGEYDASSRRRVRTQGGESFPRNSALRGGNEGGRFQARTTGGRNGDSRGRGRGKVVDSVFRRDANKGPGGKKGFISDQDGDGDNDEEKMASIGGLGDLLVEEESDDDDDDGKEGEEDDDDSFYKNRASSSLGLEKQYQAKVTPSSAGSSDSYLSETRFDQCSVSPLSLKAIKDAGYEKMTVVQEATLPVILKGKDVLAKARTGTGKTVAFLLPSIEVIVKSPPADHDNKRPPILVLVICPTRELASQAAAEANKLLKYHPSLGVQFVIGGTRLALEQKKMQANPCQILVATPGRLRDHLENTAGFATRMKGVKVLVLDEADRLLDMGFRKDLDQIIAALSKQRQTLLFSATVPEEVRQVCHFALKRDHEFINTVEEGSEETHAKVRQMHLVAPMEKHFSLLYALLRDHIADNVDYKVLVFCTTAWVTRLVSDFLGELKLNVREIHSRKAQNYRTRVSDEFRKSKGLILVTSDVSARGVDYPDVTLVIQVGLPAGREQYIHRLGRTGRKGKEGQGILLLAPWEEFFLSTMKDLPLTKASVPTVDPETTKKVERALSNVEMKHKETAYQAWLGYYNSDKKIGKDKAKLVQLANDFSRSMGLDNPPIIPKIILGKMGLKNVPGLRSK
ncbi:unnamed protein product [Linum trigynum]|uniref:ATP-dependent RNA helicase n=1 Tax=Linum trigynum TaxID=586398 RepID=A0AAV2FK06_9ROSI